MSYDMAELPDTTFRPTCTFAPQFLNKQNNKQNMKTLLKSVILVCAMAATSFATAASFTVKESKNSVFKVQYVSEQKGTVEVTILNKQNEIVFSEAISSTGSFIRPYNFSNLTEGE